MPKSYSEKFLLEVQKVDPQAMGVKLAKLCIKTNVPISYVADRLEVSRMTVHSWFRGGKIRLSLINRVEHFIKFIEQGLADGELPAPTMVQTKDYLSRHAKL
jgi:hypothetical protein